MEKPTGSIDTAETANTEKIPDNDSNSDGWKGANLKYKTRRSDPIKSSIPKLTGR